MLGIDFLFRLELFNWRRLPRHGASWRGYNPPRVHEQHAAPMRVIEQPIVIGAANNEVRKPGPVAYSCGWLAAAAVRLR